MSRRGDFFFPTHHHVIIACLPHRRMSSSSARADAVRFFGGFIWDRLLARSAVPIRLIFTRHASRDVIVPIVSLIVSPYVSSSPLAPSPDTPGGEGCLLGLAVPFMSARRGIIRPRFSSNRSSPRLLACCPMPINHWGRLRRSVSDCGDDCCVSYLLGYPIRPSVPPPFAPPNRHGERGERRGGLLA